MHGFLIAAVSSWNADSDAYTEHEKRSIIDSLPPRYRKYELDAEGRLKCPLSVEFVLDDPYIKAAVHKFKRDVSEGCYERSWQNQARKAMQERRDGKFDPYLQEQTEETFGESGSNGQGETVDEDVCAQVDSSDGEWGKRRSANRRDTKKGKTTPQTRMVQRRRKSLPGDDAR
ncbi:uncharacterized protein A1O5_11046 [Cladophialophora psammophila CBS 110553]|uniref:ASX DEUBAD domain-containing protein n=1 Tax=Cladophialophora psammophila CBS 110553 TaxID=1182543 RepID=W9WLC7_9EURO|nr:uncharacterized protein A1O5_11046 [Cladophialophora psammophila CBS 110553]EXJ65805.1 hypothetical protein A1O5_11046 [Cladophialophora psammophila CBS 110553]